MTRCGMQRVKILFNSSGEKPKPRPQGRVRPHAAGFRRGRRYQTACACTAVRAAVFTMSCTLQPRLRSLQGLASPWSTA